MKLAEPTHALKMKSKIITTLLLSTTMTMLHAEPASKQETPTNFEKDRAAILAMAGKYKVTFRFYETYSLNSEYTVRSKKYQESAHELVKVVEDTGKRIVLQHLLQVDDGTEIMVIKHWGQIWTFEDTEILEYQQGTSWKKRQYAPATVKGTWSQYVTQTDDSPRYESFGHWQHVGKTSTWRSSETSRPLPRREYSKRKDYDVVLGINTHTITPQGWTHEQANRKLVKRDGQLHFLCAERGFNSYELEKSHDFSIAETYWQNSSPFWNNVRTSWANLIQNSADINYQKKINNVSMGKAIRKLAPEEKTPALPTVDEITKTIRSYLTPSTH